MSMWKVVSIYDELVVQDSQVHHDLYKKRKEKNHCYFECINDWLSIVQQTQLDQEILLVQAYQLHPICNFSI